MISHGSLPLLPPNFTNFFFFLVTNKKLSSNLKKSAFSDVFCKMSQMQNREERMSWKIKETYFVKSVGTLYMAGARRGNPK